ncbi:MAG: ABC transporter ATP-binding protein [Inconstantimicrobium porci]|uniref:ABC transporter ATP-binding protein n=1 Tax=Inconstantimicrobium porci TaxID=2652291 RepID=A0A7X2MZZ8_9CLOT|nr:ABC transporter ATP-binding protein [Inconstantimicrobium porci]MDY5911683.1 ABC transporter ATP-binding protein [Inconstantimicrobium porci]MSR92164.1 ABC transporter ATP-binding protein [Inconstantimicrobium porci]
MIQLNNISKKYGQKKVVDNVSIEIPEGKITSFIGPNGAGKSTVLSIMSRLMKMDSGSVLIEGRAIEEWKKDDLAKKISILKQSNNISLKLTIRELVSFGRFPYSKGNLTEEDDKYIDEAINYMQLKDIEDKYIDELSGGQRQRAYIAMVIAQNTDYVFLDEPLNNLDMKHSVEIMKILRKLCNDLSKTVVIVIHDINFASCYSDYIAALKDGKVVKYGNTDEIVNKESLEEIYDMNIDVKNVDGRKICIYF